MRQVPKGRGLCNWAGSTSAAAETNLVQRLPGLFDDGSLRLLRRFEAISESQFHFLLCAERLKQVDILRAELLERREVVLLGTTGWLSSSAESQRNQAVPRASFEFSGQIPPSQMRRSARTCVDLLRRDLVYDKQRPSMSLILSIAVKVRV